MQLFLLIVCSVAPAIFPIAYNLAKPFLSEDTKNKIRILGSESPLRYYHFWETFVLFGFFAKDKHVFMIPPSNTYSAWFAWHFLMGFRSLFRVSQATNSCVGDQEKNMKKFWLKTRRCSVMYCARNVTAVN